MSTRLHRNFNQQVDDLDEGRTLAREFQVSLEGFHRDHERYTRLINGDESALDGQSFGLEAESSDTPGKMAQAIEFFKKLLQQVLAKLKLIAYQFMDWVFNKYRALKEKYRKLIDKVRDYTNPEVELSLDNLNEFAALGALMESENFTSLTGLEHSMPLAKMASEATSNGLIGREFSTEIRSLGMWLTGSYAPEGFEGVEWKTFREIPSAAKAVEQFKEHFVEKGRTYSGKIRTKQLKQLLKDLDDRQGQMEAKTRQLKTYLLTFEQRLLRRDPNAMGRRESADFFHEQSLGLAVIVYYTSAVRAGLEVRVGILTTAASMCNKALSRE